MMGAGAYVHYASCHVDAIDVPALLLHASADIVALPEHRLHVPDGEGRIAGRLINLK